MEWFVACVCCYWILVDLFVFVAIRLVDLFVAGYWIGGFWVAVGFWSRS